MSEKAHSRQSRARREQPPSQLNRRATRESRRTVVPLWQSIYRFETERALSVSEMARPLRSAFFVMLILFLAIVFTSSTGSIRLGFHIILPFRESIFHFLLATIAIVYGGTFFFTATWKALKNQTTNTSVLVSLAIVSAYLYSVVTTFFVRGTPYYDMVTLILALVLLDYWLELAVWGRAAEPIRTLPYLMPATANLVIGRTTATVPSQRVKEGDILEVHPGERVPVDGIIIEGQGLIDRSMLVGESIAIKKKAGDEVVGATLNRDGTFRMQVTRAVDDMALARMIDFSEAAQRSNAASQRTINRIVAYFIPLVVVAAVLAILIWSLSVHSGFAFALLIGIATLVVASPDALILAAPIAMVVVIGSAVRRGILIKDASVVEMASQIDIVVFEKTGCLTEGRPYVTDIHHVGKLTEAGFLRLAAGLAKASRYSLARAIVGAAEKQVGIGISHPEEFKIVPGLGVIGEIETRTILLGNKRFMIDNEIDLSRVEGKAEALARQGKTVAYVAVDENIEGILGITDDVLPDAKATIKALHDANINVAMITGENFETAIAIADELNIDKVYADVMPSGKAEIIKELQSLGERVAMVGRLLSDESALNQADIGVAVSNNSVLDFKSGNVIILSGDPFDVMDVLALGRLAEEKIKENLTWTTIYNAIAIPVAMGVLFPLLRIPLRPELAVVFASVSTIAVMVNSLRLRKSILEAESDFEAS